jgi:hypothetical protein
MSFPWTNLVTAVATLAAALGATYVKSAFDSMAEQRRLRHERESRRVDVRAEAYSDFLKAAHADARLLGRTINRLSRGRRKSEELKETLAIMGGAVEEFNSTRARLEIVGSSDAAHAASLVAQAARTLGARCARTYDDGESFNKEIAEAELSKLSILIDSFAANCRHELNETLDGAN